MVGALIAFLGLLVIALVGERIAPNEPIYFVVEHGTDPRPYEPGLVFALGSDVLGRDLLSLVLAGARATLTIVLLAGLARVIAGVLVAALGLWRPVRLLTETVADFVGAIPATVIALILIKAFVKTDTSVPVVIGALLLTGWAGPYRVIRAEVDRLAHAAFTEGARAMGAGSWRVLWRHQLPHLVPVLAMNLSQQVIASLVLVAELGVLGVLVSPVRSINLEESLSVVRTGPLVQANIPEIPEWGALLSSARTTEILWATRWVVLVPGTAFALTAIAIALIGFALARRYARRDALNDLRAGTVMAAALAALFVASSLLPERYAGAREWAAAASAELRPVTDTATVFADAGLRSYSVLRQVTTIARTGPATVRIGDATVTERYPMPSDPRPDTVHVRSLVSADLGGGGIVDAPLVFAARGIVPTAQQLPPPAFARQRDARAGAPLAPFLQTYPDDYAGIDVRGKVVLLARFLGIDTGPGGFVDGYSVGSSIESAIQRGAAAVVFVDPFAGDPRSSTSSARTARNAYVDMELESPAERTSGVPVIVIDRTAAQVLLGPLGVDVEPLLGYDPRGIQWNGSASRDLNVRAHLEVPLREDASTVTSLIGEVRDIPDATPRVVVWATRNMERGAVEPARAEVLGAMARLATARHAPFIFVDFDPHADTQAVRQALADRPILLVLVLQDLDLTTLRFTSANGDLIPAIDLYADRAGAAHEVTRRTALIQQVGAPLLGAKTVVIGSIGDPGAARDGATALIGYLAGRLALGAPELRP